jgi:hypothetical protein
MWNVDCHEMFPDLGPLKQINEWERIFLGARGSPSSLVLLAAHPVRAWCLLFPTPCADQLDYDLVVSPGMYAKYYFLLLM